jgi:hypothetical protein
MPLTEIVPWGRSFDEYRAMFALSEGDLGGRILGCGDGPASFNAKAIAERIAAVLDVETDHAMSGTRARMGSVLSSLRAMAFTAGSNRLSISATQAAFASPAFHDLTSHGGRVR